MLPLRQRDVNVYLKVCLQQFFGFAYDYHHSPPAFNFLLSLSQSATSWISMPHFMPPCALCHVPCLCALCVSGGGYLSHRRGGGVSEGAVLSLLLAWFYQKGGGVIPTKKWVINPPGGLEGVRGSQ